MPAHIGKREAGQELDGARARHIAVLMEVRRVCLTENPNKDAFRYLLAIPIIYSAWEGYFRVTCAVCLRRKCSVGRQVRKFDAPYRTLWLQREGFVEAFLRSLLNAMSPGGNAGKIGAGKFKALAKFSEEKEKWLGEPIRDSIDFDTLVMTYSNVDEQVVRLNSEIIGLDLSSIDFSRLNEIVGRRNQIAHGGLIQLPIEGDVTDLISYTESLITAFHSATASWLRAT